MLGAVTHPGNIAIAQGDRLSSALARAGTGPVVNSDLSRVFLIRTVSATDRTRRSYQIDVCAAQRGDERFDPVLRDGDKIFVPEAAEPRPYRVPPIVPTG